MPEILFCFGSKIRRNVQESLFWKSLYLARKRHLYEIPQGRIQKIQIEVAGRLASYMDSFYFAAVIVKVIQKSTEKKGGWRRPLGHPLNPRMVPMPGFTILSRLNFFSVPYSPVFPGLILNPCLQMRQVPDPKKPIEDPPPSKLSH